jgi:hypothetical protein
MPTRSATKKPVAAPAVQQIPASPPVQVEIRVDGRVRFRQVCFAPQLSMDDDTVAFGASLQPVLVDAPAASATVVRPPERFGDLANDPRDGNEVIQQVHSGRRT